MMRTRVLAGVMLLGLVLPGCTKPPRALAVELLFDEVHALQVQGYSYVRAEALNGGFIVLAQRTETAASPESTPVFWVGDGRAYLVNRKARLLAPDLEAAPAIVFELLDSALFPGFLREAFSELVEPPADEASPAVNRDSAERAPGSP